MNRITPCLWFDGQAEEAMRFYAAIFRDAKIGDVMRRDDGSVLSVMFELDGQAFMGLNGGPMYQFSPAISLFVRCDNQGEVDDYWEKLLDGGTPNRCGWLTDRYGVSWQVVPAELGDMLRGQNKEKAGAVMRALMRMVKLDVAALRQAYEDA